MSTDFEYTGSALLLTNECALIHYNKWIVSKFVRIFSARNARTALDFGAGIGSLSTIFRERTNVTPAVLEVDARQRETLRNRGYEPYASIAELPGHYDLIYTSNVLEHIEDDAAVLVALRKKLNDGGRIAVFVPAFEVIWSSMDDKVGHYRRYTKATLKNKLKTAGFKVDEIYYGDSVGFLLALAFRVSGNQSGEPSYRYLWIFDRFLLPVSRIMDIFVGSLFGKNVFAVAHASE